MAKPRSLRFWIVFWSVSIVFLAGWYLFWKIRNEGLGGMKGAIDYLPISEQRKDEARIIAELESYLMQKDDVERTFLIIFQNDMELRPGGGYIGSFGIVKIRNGQVTEMGTHDLSNFDARIPDGIDPPYPMRSTLRIDSWKLRDSNWSPDFPTNARKAEEFYRMGNGQENLDGIIAINTDVLRSFLEVTGPVEIPGFPGTYNSENAALNLEYQVERAFIKQGIPLGERKSVMNALAEAIVSKAQSLSPAGKVRLAEAILKDLEDKNVQAYLKDADLQSDIAKAGWAGAVDAASGNDYLMMVDANLGSLKSDYYVKRSFDYFVDFSQEIPKSDLRITYAHTAKTKDWMTKDYLTYLRIYVPEGSWLDGTENLGEIRFGQDLGKKYFGALFDVKVGETRTVEFKYSLSRSITPEDYRLLIQKQSGIRSLEGKITIVDRDGSRKEYQVSSEGDYSLNDNE